MHSILAILTDRKLERFRAQVPYPVFLGLITTILTTPILLVAMFDAQAREQPFVLLSLPLMLGTSLGCLFCIPMMVGFLSGYRPFRASWIVRDSGTAVELATRIRRASEACGFEVVWQPRSLDLVAVLELGNELSNSSTTHSAESAPLRLALFFSRAGLSTHRAMLKLDVRTAVAWDTGEKLRVHQLGNSLLADAHVDEVPGLSRAEGGTA